MTHCHVAGNVMHLVSSGVQHHLISQAAPIVAQTTANTHTASTSAAPPANRLPHNAAPQGFLCSNFQSRTLIRIQTMRLTLCVKKVEVFSLF